ncbi:homocitrate synthase family protein [Actinomadura meridiana]|uniref:Homocitrate synthase family protein n=1 Tax=Actinomadura meridiana TaxID=559626 RepID=A0ABP8C1N0_9ACTN
MDKLTDAEVDLLREDVNRSRVPGAYESGRWSVAPANRDPEVTGEMPGHIRLRDTSMRAIESLPGVTAPHEAKLAFLRALARSGVPEIVLGAPGPSARDPHPGGRDPDAVRAELAVVRQEGPDALVHCPFTSTLEGIDLAADLGFDAVQVAMPAFGPASGIYRASIPASRAQIVAEAAALVRRGKDRGLRVAVPFTMVSFVSDEMLTETAKAISEAGADEITLFDGPGGVGPEAYGRLVQTTLAAAPGVEVGIHPHNTFGLGVACAVAAARAGASVVESSVNGYCGGPGNADLAATAAAFEALYGVHTGLRLAELTGLARAGAEVTGRVPAVNQPITGPDAFCWGGGDWVMVERAVDPLMHNSVEPGLFGNERRVPLTAQSGPLVVAAALRRLGVDVDPSLVPVIVERCRAELATRGSGLLTDEEFGAITRSVLTA